MIRTGITRERTNRNRKRTSKKSTYGKLRRSDAALKKLIADARREARRVDREVSVSKGVVMVIGPFPHDCIVRVGPMPRRRQKR